MKRVMTRFTVLLLALVAALEAVAYRPLDPSQAVTISGDTVRWGDVEFRPSPREFLVDMSLTAEEAAALPYSFTTFNAAMEHVTDSVTVYIAPGVYWVDDPDDEEMRTGRDGREPFGLVIKANSLHLKGLTDDPHNVVICAARGHTQGAWGNFTMLDITGDDFMAENLTLGNFCNVDLEFPLDSSLNRPKRNKAITQAHVAYLHGDRAVARNVRFISRYFPAQIAIMI